MNEILEIFESKWMRLWLPVGGIAFGASILAFTEYPYPGQVIGMISVCLVALYVFIKD